MNVIPSCERWVWVELLAFDMEKPGLGVEEYLSDLGFIPEGISLLISSPDMVLQHEGLEQDAELPANYCTRFGHAGNENRQRQPWTRFLLRDLIGKLRAAGSKVFFSNFPEYQHNKFHKEWASDYPESLIPIAREQYPDGHGPSIYALSRLKDGVYFRDLFAKKLAEACRDYEFDGWHGPDCFCGHNPLQISSCDDGMIAQFLDWGATDLPAIVTDSCENNPAKMRVRVEWIWQYRRHDWITFHCDMWAKFWKAVCDALHADGRTTYVNSAWTRDPFEAMYRLGFDYRKVVEAGVDGIVVETVAGGLMLYEDKEFHYEFLSMLMHLKACVPDTKLIFLHSVKDVVENWDLLRHAPPLFEREVYALSNVYHRQPNGKLVRDVDGLMACLADGISPDEWRWMLERWKLAFESVPTRVLGGALVWSDASLDSHLKIYPETRIPSAQHLTHLLIEQNAPISLTVDVTALAQVDGPLVVLNPHTLPDKEKEMILSSGKVAVVIGPNFTGWPTAEEEFEDHFETGSQICRVYGSKSGVAPLGARPKISSNFTEDPLNAEEPLCFQLPLPFRPVSKEFLDHCAEIIRAFSGAYSVTKRMASILEAVDGAEVQHPPTHYTVPTKMKIGVSIFEKGPNLLQFAVKNSENNYSYPHFTIPQEIEAITTRSLFPVARIYPRGNKFSLILPPRGISVVDVHIKPTSAE